MSENILIVIAVVVVVAGFFYWRKRKDKVKARIRNAINRAKGD